MGKVNKKAAPKKAVVFVEKQVGGAKNGGTRMVRAKKLANDVPTVDAAALGTSKNFFSNHVRKVRASLTAGTVAIVLAGGHLHKARHLQSLCAREHQRQVLRQGEGR